MNPEQTEKNLEEEVTLTMVTSGRWFVNFAEGEYERLALFIAKLTGEEREDDSATASPPRISPSGAFIFVLEEGLNENSSQPHFLRF